MWFAQITFVFTGVIGRWLPDEAIMWQILALEPVTSWVGRHVLGVDAVLHRDSGSGDQAAVWVGVFRRRCCGCRSAVRTRTRSCWVPRRYWAGYCCSCHAPPPSRRLRPRCSGRSTGSSVSIWASSTSPPAATVTARAGLWLTRYRKRQQRLRARLQAKKTSSARRLLQKRRRKEARFAADINHQISKRIAAEAQRTGRGIAVEALAGIRARVRLRKPQRAAVHSWAFAQLGAFVAYKAQAWPGWRSCRSTRAYTSQTCHACGWVDKRNRRSQSEFECGRCGFVGHADHNAAINIAARGVKRWGEVMHPHAAPTLTASPLGRQQQA